MNFTADKRLQILSMLATAMLASCTFASNGKFLKKIMADGDYCTQYNQHSCQIGGYIVLGPDQKSLLDIVSSKSFNEFIPSQSCINDRFLIGDISGKLYSFCELDTLPNSYSLDEKFKFIKSAI